MSNLFLLYVLLTIIFLLSGVLIIVIQYLLNVLKKNHLYQKDIEKIENDIFHHNQKMIDHARQKAQEIIIEANAKANQIVRQANNLEQQTTQDAEKLSNQLLETQRQELELVRRELASHYKTLLEELYQNNVNLFKNISKDIEGRASLEIKDFKEILEKETLGSQKIVGEKIESRYQEVQKELEQYREQELQKLRNNIYGITQKAVELALGRWLDREVHETLMMDALKEAIEKNQEA